MSDEQERLLAERCARGDAAAWRLLVGQFDAFIIVLLARVLGSRAAAEVQDLRQVVYQRLHAGALRAFRGEHPGALKRYLGRMALGVARDHLRKFRRDEKLVSEVEKGEASAAGPASPEEAAVQAQEQQTLQRALLPLAEGPQRDRDLIILRAHFRDGLSPGEIYRMGVGLTEKGIDTFLRRAAERLRAGLTRRG